MNMDTKIACVFGGTGFVGRHVVRELAAKGYTIKVATRVPERAYFLRPAGVVGQVVPFTCNAQDAQSVGDAVKGCDVVVNCIGILAEKGKKQRFQNIHVDVPAMIAKACNDAGVENFIHISALGVDASRSKYCKSKLEGEAVVLKNFEGATILRPSIIFGEDDSFFNMFAKMAQIAPALPLIGGGKTKFQPVYVGDVSDAVMVAISKDAAKGEIYELGGPDILSFKELYEEMFSHTKRPRALVSIPFPIAKVQAFFMGVLPNPPLTRDQVESLKTDNVVSADAQTLYDLGIEPTALDVILPRYLERYRAGGRFADIKAA